MDNLPLIALLLVITVLVTDCVSIERARKAITEKCISHGQILSDGVTIRCPIEIMIDE
jgi:hypothetical protein